MTVLAFLSRIGRGCFIDEVVAYLQFCVDWHQAGQFVAWANTVDDYLLQNGQSEETRAAALRAAGSMPSFWLKRVAVAWLRWRGLRVFYRGQRRLAPYADFLSSIASGERVYHSDTGIRASVRLAEDLLSHEISPWQMTAKWDGEPVRLFSLPPELQGEVIGGAGIPFSTNLPVAAAYAQRQGEFIYVTLQRIEDLNAADGWGYEWESEWVALHQVSRMSIVKSIRIGVLPSYGPPH
jgi:hypothetical protein